MNRSCIALTIAALGFAGPALGQNIDPAEQVRKVLIARNADSREALLRAFLALPTPANDARIRSLAAEVYSSELRLSVLNVDRPLIGERTAFIEVPARVLEQRADMTLDPFAPLAGRSFLLPSGRAK
jgi:hypothetical protein